MTNDGSYVGIARDLVEVESRRKMAELYLEHFQRENKDFKGKQEDMDREIESRFLADPVVHELKAKLDRVNDQLAEARRIARSDSDPAVRSLTKRAETLKSEYQRHWDSKAPEIEETLSVDANPALGADYRVAEAEVITLKAREAALRERLDQVAVEELDKLRRQHETLRREHGDSNPQVAHLKSRIAGIEGRQQQAVDVPGGGASSNALLDYMSQSLESIEAMRVDLQKKFDEDLERSKKDEITLLEESNLRNNLERQRSLYLSVLDQLKQARLVSDYDSVSTQTIAPISVSADPRLTMPILLLAAVIGVGLGGGVAFLADMLEARVRTLAEIRKLVDVPLIGVIPLIRDDQAVAAGTAGLLSHHKPRSALAESYKATRTNLEFLRRSRQAHVLLVASSLPGDGKSTTVSNLAISLANAGAGSCSWTGTSASPRSIASSTCRSRAASPTPCCRASRSIGSSSRHSSTTCTCSPQGATCRTRRRCWPRSGWERCSKSFGPCMT